MKIFITGGSGFVGTMLTRELTRRGHAVTILTRSLKPGGRPEQGASFYQGNPVEPGPWQEEAARHDVIINLAGTSIFARWSEPAKKEIRESRILTTRNLVEAIRKIEGRETRLISASAVGYYGFHDDELLDEAAPPGDDFLAGVTRDWEAEALKAASTDVKVALPRFGIVLGRQGGMLGQLAPLFRRGLGASLGSGRQWFSWIHEIDLARIFLFLIDCPLFEGPLNCTAPNPVTNRELTAALAGSLGKTAFLPNVPGFVLRLVKGEFGSVILKGQRVVPARLLKAGFEFQFSTLEPALRDLLAR